MKKILSIILCVCFLLVGCETGTAVRAGHISEITGALSTNYAIKVVLDNDDRVSEKYVDLQLKSSKANQTLTFGEEMEDPFTICLPKEDYWYNLTYLISQTNGATGKESYQGYEEFGNRIFMFTSQNDVKLTFRVVVGDKKTNSETGEEILVLSESISEEVVVDVKANKE